LKVDTDVAVVGGGPVGMLLAGELALHGVRTTVLEALPAPTGESKAGTLHARTAQTLRRRGLLDAVQPYPERTPPNARRSVPFHFGGLFSLDLGPVVAEGPAMIGSPQAYAETVFTRRALKFGARIRRDSEVTSVEDVGPHAVVRLRNEAGEESQLTAGWVVGCDGPRSVVRKQAGIEFTGTLPTMSCLMGEALLEDPYGVPAGWNRTPNGWTIFWVNPRGHSRIGTYDFRGPAADRKAPVTLTELRQEAERITGRSVPMRSPRWLTRFSDAALQAQQYQVGRILLAGDAAHVHFPAGGQGLNTGLQDAVNLGWKLAAQVQGWAPEGLLESYHSERHPVGADVLQNVRAQVALMNPDPAADALRELFSTLMQMDEVNDYLAGMITGTDIRYNCGLPRDPIAGSFVDDAVLKTEEGQVTVADLLQAGRGVLLVLGDLPDVEAAALGWASRVDTVRAVSDRNLGFGSVLLRPDGYAAWSAQEGSGDLGSLNTALTRWFGAPS